MKLESRLNTALFVVACLLFVFPAMSARARNPVDIYLNGTYISGQTVNVSAGQLLNFQAGFHLAPPSGGETYTMTFQWTIEGNPIKSYTTGTTAFWTPLSDPDYRNGSFSCYLLDGGNANVTVAATVTSSTRGTLVNSSMTAGLNVYKPSGITLVPTPGSNVYTDTDGMATLSIGTPTTDPGLTITSTGISVATPGSVDWAQVLHTYSSTRVYLPVTTLSYDQTLDSAIPYGQSYMHFEDTPMIGTGDPLGVNPQLSLSFSATTYLIWKCDSPGAIWLPLASLDWSADANEEFGYLYGDDPTVTNIHNTVSLPITWDDTLNLRG